MTSCSETSHCILSSIGCFIYDFQTLLTGIVAIGVAVIAGIPVWRQLKDSNLQTRISHRETLATLLRDALRRYDRVEKSIRDPLSFASRATSDPMGEPLELGTEDAHHLQGAMNGVLDWYLVILKDTEHADIESRKSELKSALARLVETAGDAHWADINDQHDEDNNFSDEEWAAIEARCAAAKVEATKCVSDVEKAYRKLREAQQQWVQSLRTQIARLDLQIAAPR
ncbi:hypothetical protein [Sphingomonas soli]|uniref:hypothetical protein n=1 Tax=Sphingomonas soli TaxID=266127 RepID=UPI0012ECD53B|nr:hypothetical protein [Sphingomonas soli]